MYYDLWYYKRHNFDLSSEALPAETRTLTNDDIAKIRLVLSCGAQWDYVNSEGVTASQFYPREIFNQSPVCN